MQVSSIISMGGSHCNLHADYPTSHPISQLVLHSTGQCMGLVMFLTHFVLTSLCFDLSMRVSYNYDRAY